MEGLAIIEFDPLCTESAESYVESVMTPKINKVATTEIHAAANTSELISNLNKGASLKRPLDSDSSYTESVKKLRSDDSHSIATKVCSNTDMSDLKHLVYSLTQSMNTMHISLS